MDEYCPEDCFKHQKKGGQKKKFAIECRWIKCRFHCNADIFKSMFEWHTYGKYATAKSRDTALTALTQRHRNTEFRKVDL